ncbi:ABC transporter permease subunit [Micromonospora marina]|uniref:ABC transporter permease subunit n=1 Tax=Micromonospora marina TaxID=307120 RepID=UPI0034522414
MDIYLQLLVLGLVTGSVYALSAAGIILAYRASAVVNFAHGAIGTLGGYLMWTFAQRWGWPTPAGLTAAVAATGVVGLLAYLLVVRPLSRTSTLNGVVGTLAVHLVVQQVILIVFGSELQVPPSFLPDGVLSAGRIAVGVDQVVIVATAIGLTTALWAGYRWTRFGLATSAVAENPRALEALGHRPGLVRAANWTVAGAVTGAAGVVLAPTLQLSPGYFTTILIPTLAAAMLGRMRSFPLALAGGLTLGVLQAECARLLPYYGISDAIPFVVIVVLLAVRGSTVPRRDEVGERLPRVTRGFVRGRRLASAVAVVATAIPIVPDLRVLDGITLTVALATIFLSQVVVTGYAGQISLVQFPVAGIGAMAAGWLAANAHLSFPAVLLTGAAAGAAAGALSALPAIRVRGVSLAIATLALGVALNAVVLTNPGLSGGLAGTESGHPSVFGWKVTALSHPRRYAIVAGVCLLVLALLVTRLRHGRLGRRMLAVRANERAAYALGIDVAGTKVTAFALAGLVAGVGGVLVSFRNPVMTYREFDAWTSATSLVHPMIGGIGYPLGGVLGALGARGGTITSVADLWLMDVAVYLTLVVGVLVVIQLVAQPNGIAGILAGRSRAAGDRPPRRRPASARPPAAAPRRRPAAPATRDGTPATRDGAALRVERAVVSYGGVRALDGVSFEVAPGELLAVIGPNGSGKTSLLDALTGFCEMSGRVTLDGRDVSGAAPHRRARQGMVRSFQSADLFDDLTVGENLRCARESTGRGADDQRLTGIVDALDLRALLDAEPASLGYGTRRLVGLARALCAGPRLLLLDEPASGLSTVERREVADLLRTVAHRWGTSVILVEHDVDLVARVADRIVALDAGRTIAVGPPATVLADPAVRDAYLGAGGLAGVRG